MPSTGSSSHRWAAGFATGMLSAKASTGSPTSSGELRVPLPEIERAWQNLAKRRIYSVPGVALTQAQIDALGL